MVVVNGGNGSIRSTGQRAPRRDACRSTSMRIPARSFRTTPSVCDLGLEYNPRTPATDGALPSHPPCTEQITVMLDPGKPLIISQAADPASDRKITVEVRATMMK